jgi:hypothetical protein
MSQEVVKTAACAASTGDAVSRQASLRGQLIERALANGRRAAEHGICLPLPVLLDVETLGSGERENTHFMLRSSGGQKATDYDKWVLDVSSQARTLAVRRFPFDEEIGLNGGRPLPGDYLPMLMHRWISDFRPKVQERETARWAAAMDELSLKHQQEIEQLWCGPRSTSDSLWKWWPARNSSESDTAPSVAGTLWSCVAAQSGTSDVAANFDNWSAEYFFNADDPHPMPDQRRKILTLLQQYKQVFELIKEVPDDQDPHIGEIPLSVLVKEPFEEVIVTVMNHWTSYLNNHRSKRPPRKITIHLCWANDYWAENNTHPWRRSKRGSIVHVESPAGREGWFKDASPDCPLMSTLKGLVGLTLDDWRSITSIVKKVPIRFKLHDSARNEVNSGEIRPGGRWKPRVAAGTPMALPALGLVLSRLSVIRSARARLELGMGIAAEKLLTPPPQDWYCGFVLKHQLNDFGFIPVRKDGASGSQTGLIFRGGRMPWRLHHLIVVNEPFGAAEIFQVKEPAGDGAMELWRRPVRRGLLEAIDSEEKCDPSFLAMRCEAIDVLLEAIAMRII